jgi:hypothetical protein
MAIAQTIADVGKAKGVGRQGVIIGVMTGMAESDLTNVDHGDAPGPSSRGVFQQMPGWGPESVRMDPAGAAGLFFDALRATPWTTLKPWVAAQRVQQSEFVAGFTGEGSDGTEGWNYLQRYPAAIQVVAQLSGVDGTIPPTAPPTPTTGDTVTHEELAALNTRLDQIAALIETDRGRLDTLIHAQEALGINEVLPYLQRIAGHLGV